eukprot:2184751-Amphidinium_carterae.1
MHSPITTVTLHGLDNYHHATNPTGTLLRDRYIKLSTMFTEMCLELALPSHRMRCWSVIISESNYVYIVAYHTAARQTKPKAPRSPLTVTYH